MSTNNNKTIIHAFYEKICTENLPKTKLFGVPLEEYMAYQKQKIPFLNEPWIVKKCCHFLMEKGLKSEGIFRVPGSHSTIETLVEMFDKGENPNFETLPAYVEDVAGTLKKYLRDQPQPLISDGTPNDLLQNQFIEVLSLEESSEEQLHELKNLLSHLSIFRKTVLIDLFGLLSAVAKNSASNLMSPDNLATIFGGMTHIMSNLLNATQRTTIVRIFINHYDFLFKDLEYLTRKPEDPSLENTKDAVRIYLHDGTFKSMFVHSNETSKDIKKKTLSKIQQTMDIDTSKYRIYELRDSLFRRIGSDEKVLNIWKSGSAILISDSLKPEKIRTISKSKDKDIMPQKTKLQETPTNVFDTWVFPEIPKDSLRASDWDIDNSIEGTINIYPGDENNVVIKLDNKQWEFNVSDIHPVEDSSRYYSFLKEEYQVGVGFETREMSSLFRETLKIGEKVETKPQEEKPKEEEPSSPSEIFSNGPLNQINDLFYDAGLSTEPIRPIDELLAMEVNLESKEVILVDETKDEALTKILDQLKSILNNSKDIYNILTITSLYVSSLMGGVNHHNVEDELSIISLSKKNIVSLKQKLNSNCIPIGLISHGTSRHRSILFKYLLDRINLELKSMLCRVDTLKHNDDEEYFVLIENEDKKLMYIDLYNNPGQIIIQGNESSDKIENLINKIHGSLSCGNN